MVGNLGSLFDGIGGFPLSGVRHGITPVWASEIEPWPIKVTEKHFPDMVHLGDITKINGAEIEPVDIITFGSPCQDLSVAGKRAGLEGQRSGLFMAAGRIIRQMRTATGGRYPRFAVWENVPGAFSSNKGQDFRAVLEEIGNAEIPMPASGKWATAGMVRTEECEIAWRTLDAQHWGVAQRRRRIFLVADFAGQCAGEILFEREGLRGNLAESRKAREEAAATVGDGVAKSVCIRMREGCDGGGKGPLISEDKSLTLGCSNDQTLMVLADQGGSQMDVLENLSPTLRAQEHGHQPIVATRIDSTPEGISGAVSSKWARGTGGPAGDECYNLVIEPQLYDMTHAEEVLRPVKTGLSPTLNSRMGTGGNQVPVMLAFAAKQRDEVRDLGDKSGALQAQPGMKQQTFVASKTTRTITARNDGSPCVDRGPEVIVQGYAVRRLTPLECTRLQGFPDDWLDIEGMSDTAKYKAIGNSVAVPCVEFVMSGIARVMKENNQCR